jgi:uncharacterized protein
MIELSTHETMRAIGESEYSALVRDDTPPFLSFAFLDALERTGCVGADRGWHPCHLALRKDGELVAVAPAYLKENSEGEFVFDWGWAEFAEGRLRIPYYPKLIVAVPFTPATGPRLLIRDGFDESELVSALGSLLPRVVDKLGVSSAHVLFPTETQASSLVGAGLLHRCGLQYHWHNAGYDGFDDFLGRFSSKRRNQIKREVRGPEEQGLSLETFDGSELGADLIDAVFDFYLSTVDRHFYGRRYLNREFFHEVCASMPKAVHVVLARERQSGRPLAGAFNLVGKTALYGRYWGAYEERPFLHFNVCYYQGIRDCIARGLDLFEPGAGGEHKLARGFEPTRTHSAHHLVDRRLNFAVEDFVKRERAAIDQHLRQYEESPVLKRD